MKRFIIRLSIFSGLSALAYGLYVYYNNQIKLAMQYCYKLTGIKIITFTKDNVSFNIFLKILNRSSFALNLNGYDLDVYLNNKKVANVKSNKHEILANNGVSDLSLLINFSPSQFFDGAFIKSLLLFYLVDKTKIVLDIKGNFNAKMNFIGIKLPIDVKLTLAEMLAPSTDSEAEKKKIKCNF